MTKPSLSWIEPSALQALLARASAPVRPVVEAPRPAVPAPVSHAGRTGRTLPPPPMLPSPSLVDPESTAGRLPGFERPDGSVEARLQAFLTWIHRSVVPLAAFVADEGGLPLAAFADDTLVAVTAPCMAIFQYLATLYGHEPRGRLVLVVDGKKLLHVAEVATRWGRFNVSILSATTIPDSTMMTIQQGLATALSDQEHDR